jgi:predicted Zn-dependent protease
VGRAEAILRDAVARNPADTGPGLELVKLLSASDRSGEAEDLLTDWAARADGSVIDYALALAAIDEAKRRLSEAKARLEGILATEPGHPAAARHLGRLHTLTGALEDAVDVLTRAHRAHPDDRKFARDCCKALPRLGQAGEGEDGHGAVARQRSGACGFELRHPDDGVMFDGARDPQGRRAR